MCFCNGNPLTFSSLSPMHQIKGKDQCSKEFLTFRIKMWKRLGRQRRRHSRPVFGKLRLLWSLFHRFSENVIKKKKICSPVFLNTNTTWFLLSRPVAEIIVVTSVGLTVYPGGCTVLSIAVNMRVLVHSLRFFLDWLVVLYLILLWNCSNDNWILSLISQYLWLRLWSWLCIRIVSIVTEISISTAR